MSDYQTLEKYVSDICGEYGMLELLTIGHKDKSGAFIKGADMSLEGAIAILEFTTINRNYSDMPLVPTIPKIYRLFKEIEEKRKLKVAKS